MTGPGHGRIRAVAMDGNSEDASLRAPGRNVRRSAGHGKRRAQWGIRNAERGMKRKRLFQHVQGSSRDGRSVSGWQFFTASKSKNSALRIPASEFESDRRRPRPWKAGCNMAEPYTLLEGTWRGSPACKVVRSVESDR